MVRNMVFFVLSLVVFGWGLSALYYAQMDFAEIVKDPEPPWFIEINTMPIFIAIILGGIFTFITYPALKKKRKSWKNVFMLPPEFEESDEREKEITAKACRASYVSMWHSFPFIASLLLLYPFISDSVPYYHILVILLLPLIQGISYFLSWRKNY